MKRRVRFGMLSLLIVVTIVAIGCGIARLPVPLTLRVALLWMLLWSIVGWMTQQRIPRMVTNQGE